MIEISEPAAKDMEELYDYIAVQLLSPEYAIGQYNRIAEAILTLDCFPERNKLVESDLERSKGLRRLLVDNYVVFYIVMEHKVVVTNVLYSASDVLTRMGLK